MLLYFRSFDNNTFFPRATVVSRGGETMRTALAVLTAVFLMAPSVAQAQEEIEKSNLDIAFDASTQEVVLEVRGQVPVVRRGAMTLNIRGSASEGLGRGFGLVGVVLRKDELLIEAGAGPGYSQGLSGAFVGHLEYQRVSASFEVERHPHHGLWQRGVFRITTWREIKLGVLHQGTHEHTFNGALVMIPIDPEKKLLPELLGEVSVKGEAIVGFTWIW